jgi:hypothetical protein
MLALLCWHGAADACAIPGSACPDQVRHLTVLQTMRCLYRQSVRGAAGEVDGSDAHGAAGAYAGSDKLAAGMGGAGWGGAVLGLERLVKGPERASHFGSN